jgi:hypothetical protein
MAFSRVAAPGRIFIASPFPSGPGVWFDTCGIYCQSVIWPLWPENLCNSCGSLVFYAVILRQFPKGKL